MSVHIIANVGDRRALCGHDLRRDKRAAWCWEPHALAHVDGHNMVICDGCAVHLLDAPVPDPATDASYDREP